MELIYQVLPRCWGKGRFSDWDKPAFDYLKSLGITCIWYTGVIRHSSGKTYVKGNPGSPYSIVDYRDVNPYLADSEKARMSEFRSLVKRTHAAGLKVLIDFVPNHVSPDCRDVPTLDHCDYDWTDTRKIDYGRREAWDAMLDIALFWAGQGIDGFRCDMVEMVPPEFMAFLISGVRSKYPSAMFVAELYDRNNYRRYIEELGFDLLYDKSGWYDSVRAILCSGASARALTWNWQYLQDLQPRMLNFLENHDEQRLASPYFASDPHKAFAALAAGALFNGASFMLYSGQELGEKASEGHEGRTSIFNWSHPRSISRLCSDISGLGGLQKKELAVLERYRSILSLCSEPVFREGRSYDLCWCNGDRINPDRHFAFLRYLDGDARLVFCNFSDAPAKADIYLPDDLRAQLPGCPSHAVVRARPWDAAIICLSLQV